MYANISVIFISEIGVVPDEGLQCITDRMHSFRRGNWFFPNGTLVPTQDNGSNTFIQRRGLDDGTIILNRASADFTSPNGLFCCVIPDISDNIQRVCVNLDICELNKHFVLFK